MITEPTRFRHGQSNNILDLLVAECEDDIKNIDFFPPLGKSDHCVLTFCVCHKIQHSHKNSNEFPIVKKFNFNKGNYMELTNYLGDFKEEFEEFGLNNVIDDVMDKYVKIVNYAMIKCIPLFPNLNKNNTTYKGLIPTYILKLI